MISHFAFVAEFLELLVLGLSIERSEAFSFITSCGKIVPGVSFTVIVATEC